MPLPAGDYYRGNWSNRVRFTDGPNAFAYAPGRLLAPDDANETVVAVLGDSATFIDTDPEGGPGPGPVQGYTTRWRYPGDIIRAVSRLRAAGVRKAQPIHVFFLDQASSMPGSVEANPVYANPVYANPVYANPVYANPVYANPVNANPVYANPVYANPVYANPVYANPVYANPGSSSRPPGTPIHSLVYPNPVYAFDRLDNREVALRFRASGARRSQAQPAGQVGEDTLATANGPAWDQDCIRVAVLDSGFDSVSDRLTRDAATGANDTRLAGPPFDAVDEFDPDADGYLDPVSGHGTFIAGIVHRVAPRAAVCVQQVVSSFGDGHEDVIIAHLDALITRADPPHIINLSFSGYVLDKPGALQAAIGRAIAKGIVVVASAGNDGIDRKAYPAAFRGVVAVAATGPGGPAPFSNHGGWVDACAPGVDVTSWFFTQDGVRARKHGYDPDDFTGWATWSGTSFAAPVVTGALARAAHDQHLTAAQGVEVLIDQPGLHRLPGYGTLINVLGAAPEYVW